MIGYYAHHQGAGHGVRAGVVARLLDDHVTLLSTRAPFEADAFDDWVRLDRDDLSDHPIEPTAAGALHWAPVDEPGHQDKMAAIATWIARLRPTVMVVDVSAEVCVLARLCGVRTIVVAQPGDRSDGPHQLAYRLADAIVAPWTRAVYAPPWLRAFEAKTVYTGAFSRFDDRARPRPNAHDRRRVLLLGGAGGAAFGRVPTQGTDTWTTLGADGRWSVDLWSELANADVVVTHGGLNAVAEIAAARRPAVLVPQKRPFDEQHTTARAIAAAGIATTLHTWPRDSEWAGVLDAAVEHGGSRWSDWAPGDGAAMAARAIESVAARSAVALA